MTKIDLREINLTTAMLLEEACKSVRDKIFVEFPSQQYKETYGDFQTQVNRLTNLLEEKGVTRNDKVAIMADNTPEYLHIFSAVTNMGAIFCTVITRLVGESLRYVIDVSDCSYVCVSSPYRKQVKEVVEKIERPIQILSIEELSEAARGKSIEYRSPAKPDDICYLIYTSGTTGFPKGVLHTHKSIIRTGVKNEGIPEVKSDDRVYIHMPFFHIWAYLIMWGVMYFKATMVVVDRFNADTFWKEVDRYKITQCRWTGTVPLNLLKLPQSDLEQKARMTVYGTIGAMYETLKERWPNIRFQSVYGLTEHPGITGVPADETYPCSDGIPDPADKVFIVDESRNPLPTGETGEIMVSCKCGVHMQGYYKNPEATAEALRGDDLYTGDLGHLDERGHLHFDGRKKDALRVRGEMVSVDHTEYLINQHPKIAESAIVGYRPAEKEALKEDEIVAHIVVKQGEQLSVREFHEWSEENLARFMRPKYVIFRDSMPKTVTERIQHFVLKEEGTKGTTKLF